MNRIVDIEIAGKNYPLNFSVRAAKEISGKYKGLENIDKAFTDKSTEEMMDEVIWLLSVLIKQGVAYKKVNEGEEVSGISAEDLEIVLGVADLAGMKDKIIEAMNGGMNRTVEVETDPKNGETTQGN